MPHLIPTVRVKHPDDPNVMMTINQSDLREDHVRWDEAGMDEAMRVGKGPRGKWYVKMGRENVEGPFETEEEAQAVMSATP